MPDKFDIGFKLLPPDLQMKLWVLALDANTGKVAIAYQANSFKTSLRYNYGGNIEAALSIQRLTTTVGINPTNADVSLGLVFRGFNFGTSASPTQKSVGVNIGYGASLLPFPNELATTFNAAGTGLASMADDIGQAPNNPLAWYKLHSNDVGTITKAVNLGQQIDKLSDKSNRFGIGLRLNYSQPTGLTIYGGAQLSF